MTEHTYQVERAEKGGDLHVQFSSDVLKEADKHYDNAVRLVSACGGEARLVAREDGQEAVLAQFKRAR